MRLPDPRDTGSNNPGATNVLRYGGKKAAIIALSGDIFKGFLPVILAQQLSLDVVWICAIALAAFLGHLYPLYFSFKGGKGVATALGILLAICPWAGLGTLLTWLLIFGLTRLSSLAALAAALLSPAYIWFFLNDINYLIISTLLSILLFWRHRSNIVRLVQGQEHRFTK